MGSALLHAGLALMFNGWGASPIGVAPANVERLASAWRALAVTPSSELLPGEEPTEVAMVPEQQALPERWQTRTQGDDNASVLETAPRVAQGQDPRAPAHEGGEGSGATRRDAWRKDNQDLRADLTDGSSSNRVARTRLGRTNTSPQAERRERNTGIGDVPRTAKEALALTAAVTNNAGETDEDVLERGRREALRPRAGAMAQTGEGPLEARTGQRRFDAEKRGPAVDVLDQRSASNERRPGPIDLVAPGTQSEGDSPKGVGDTPGAVPDKTHGASATLYGAPSPLPAGPKVAMSAREAERLRYEREIRRRAQSMLVFPRKLALALQQGETIVRFLVRADGAVSGSVDVTKSAGFREFDEEARLAVQKAAPFPRMPGPLVVNMRFVFENPVLR
ncbi:MAG: TonB family protein [Deltaproteobacteria bacterium]|nr:TonB family protein [Deltaproteobacteria bacterium]